MALPAATQAIVSAMNGRNPLDHYIE